jgi:hypothetical protein
MKMVTKWPKKKQLNTLYQKIYDTIWKPEYLSGMRLGYGLDDQGFEF